ETGAGSRRRSRNRAVHPAALFSCEGRRMSSNQQVASSLTLRVNGTEERLDGATISELLASRELPAARGVAVALNGRVVPRDAWATTILHDGDAVEIVRAMQGG